jgi:hypothetical protein
MSLNPTVVNAVTGEYEASSRVIRLGKGIRRRSVH